MPRWLGSLGDQEARALDELSTELRALAPNGWSIVKGQSGLVVRPRERRLGKFSLTPSTDGAYYVAFYSPFERRWVNNNYFAINDHVAKDMLQWMVAIVAG